jgi:hypothetical protein
MYDMDQAPSGMKTAAGRGGNTTIAIGHLIHYGAIGSTQYDSRALVKEKVFKDGLTIDAAFQVLSDDLTDRMPKLKSLMTANNITDPPDQSVQDVFMDYIFNTGRYSTATKGAAATYKKSGVLGLFMSIKKGLIKSISDSRRDMRLKLLEKAKAIENFNKGVDKPMNMPSPSDAFRLDRYRLDYYYAIDRNNVFVVILGTML